MIISEDEVMREIENILYSCLGMQYNDTTRGIVYSKIQSYLAEVISPVTVLIAKSYRIDDWNTVFAICDGFEWAVAFCSSYQEAERYIRDCNHRLNVKVVQLPEGVINMEVIK